MKELFRKSTPVLALLLIALIIIIGRSCCPKPEPGGKQTQVKGEPVKSPIAISFIDANRFADAQVSTVKVTIVDSGGKVLTINGLPISVMEITGGVMTLALQQDAKYSETEPYYFAIKAEAAGYTSTIKHVAVTDDKGQFVPVFMAKLNDLPPGIAAATGIAPLNNGILPATLNIAPKDPANALTGKVTLDIPKGTQLIYCDQGAPGSPAPDKLNYQVAYGSPLSPGASRVFPGGPFVPWAYDRNGNRIPEPFYFASAGWINIDMDADGRKVSGFTNPVKLTMPISDTLRIAPGGGFLKSGDSIDIWSLNDQGIWRQEGMAYVTGQPGSLKATLSVTHLSTWNLDFKVDICCDPPNPAATLNYTNNRGAMVNQYSEIIDANTGALMRHKDFDYAAGAGHSHSLINLPRQMDMVLRVYSAGPGTAQWGTSTVLSCTNTTADLTIPAAGGLSTITINFQVKNAAGAATATPLCPNAVWFKPCTGAGCTAGNCAASTSAFLFGGILSISGPANNRMGTVTMTSPNAFVSQGHCIRLWYSGKDAANNDVQQTVDFSFDFPAVVPAGAITGRKTIAGVTSNLTIWPSLLAANNYLFEIDNGVNGITPIDNCNN